MSTSIKWRKSSYSSGQGNCVEVAELADGTRLVRDTNDRDGGMLRFPAGAWRSLTEEIRQR